MDAKEPIQTRLEMAAMHEEYIDRLSTAYDNHNYVEAVWICYAIFEQRISRLIAKYIDNCTIPERSDNKTASISTRINCIKKMIKSRYGAFEQFDPAIIDDIKTWCDKRNDLVHGLVSLSHYKEYDQEFESLAEEGVPLVFALYDECTNFRNRWYMSENEEKEFPQKKCKCKKEKCINPKCI